MDIQQNKKRIKHEQNMIAFIQDIENQKISIDSISQDILDYLYEIITETKMNESQNHKKSLLGASLRNK